MARYAIGIDLGTTHCALSYLNLEAGQARGAAQAMLPVPQLVAPGTLDSRQLLPSFLYLPSEQEFAPGALALPWEPGARDDRRRARAHPRRQGPGAPGLQRQELAVAIPAWTAPRALLPWNAPPEVKKVSAAGGQRPLPAPPAQAWEQGLGEGAPLAEQELILTVPASFDAAARELTLTAAREAGLPTPTLLEEPQAALYAWLEAAGDDFRKQVSVGDVILVVDVGGGTTDLSLIAVTGEEGEVQLTRLAVGDHILLGGDNMDLALAYHLAARFKEQGKTLDAVQMNGLVHGARQAKEPLFADPALAAAPVTVASRGASLLGGTLKTELKREELDQLLTDGFFPRVEVTELPRTARRTGLTQIALPYAQDPGVTRHLAAFLTRQARALEGSADAPVGVAGRAFLHPNAVLFNGGVFKAPALKARLREVLDGWLAADGGAAGEGALGRRSRSLRRARRELLRLGAARARPAHPRRHGARVLRGGGDGDDGRSRAWSLR